VYNSRSQKASATHGEATECIMTSEEWDVLVHACACLLAQEGIFGTDRTLPAKIDAVIAAKQEEIERLEQSCLGDPDLKDIDKLVPSVARLSEEQGILVMASHMMQDKYDQMLKDKPKAYIALHGLITLSRTYRAALYARAAREIGGGSMLPDSERQRATKLILTAH
jgi:hypothetical protein